MITAGVLFAGEMGTALAKLLLGGGHVVVTTLEGRSQRTVKRCAAAGIMVLPSLRDVVTHSHLLISSVPPAAAADVARRVAAEASSKLSPIFLDTNSVSPVTMSRIGAAFERTGVSVVDASIHGLANHLETRATLYLSGARAQTVSEIFGSPPRTVILGSEIGRASLFKMLLGGTSKGIVALLLELSDLALREGVLNEFWTECRAWYPGVLDQFERVLPSYPQHVRRRVEEMRELSRTVSNAGAEPIMAAAIGDRLARVATSPSTLRVVVNHIATTSPDEDGRA